MYCVRHSVRYYVLCTPQPQAHYTATNAVQIPTVTCPTFGKGKTSNCMPPPLSRSSLQVVGAPPCSPSRRPLALPSAGVPPGLRSPGIHCGGGTQHHHERLARAMRRTCYAIQPVPASGLQPTSSQSGMSILLLFPAPLRSYDRPLFSSCPITAPSPTLFALRPGSKVYCAPP